VVVAPGSEDRVETRLGGRIIWVKSPPLPLDPRYHLLLRERAVHAVVRAENPDVIEGSSPWSGGWFAARAPGSAPRALIFHQDAVAVYGHSLFDRHVAAARLDRIAHPYWGYLRALSSHFDRTIVSGAWLADRLTGFGVRAPTAVPFGVDRARFSLARPCPAKRAALLSSCGLGSRATLLVAVSRLHPEKRVGTLIDAVARLAGSSAFPHGLGLVVVGDGPLATYLRARARAVKGVHFAGFFAEPSGLPDVLACADAFLHGSSAETYGLVVGEALAAGVPLIVPSMGGAAELARGEYAEMYRAGDPADCAAAIERFAQRDQVGMRAAAAHAGRTMVLDAERHFDGLFATYRGMVRDARGS
jgi:alpha-1,6-mannosyltransferase